MPRAQLVSLFIWLFLFSAHAHAQKKWTLDACIDYAQEHNIQLKKYELQVNLDQIAVSEAKAAFLPSLGLSSTATGRFGRSVDPLTYQFTTDQSRGSAASVYSQIKLFNGFKYINDLAKSKLDLKARLAMFEQAEQDLAMQITRNFLDILHLDELLQCRKNDLSLSREQLKQAKVLRDAGQIIEGEVLDMAAQLSLEEAQMGAASNQLMLARLSLAQLLEIEDFQSFEIAQPTDLLSGIGLDLSYPDEVYSRSSQNFPGIQAAFFQLESARKKLAIEKGNRLPDISLAGGWGTGYSNQIMDAMTGHVMAFSDQLNFNSTSYVRISMGIPILNGLKTHNSIRRSEIHVFTRELDLEAEKKNLKKIIQTIHAEAMAARMKFKSMEKSLEAMELAYENAKSMFNKGAITGLQFNTAKNKLSLTQSELLQAKYNYLFNKELLNFYLKSSK